MRRMGWILVDRRILLRPAGRPSAETGSPGRPCVAHEKYASIGIVSKPGKRMFGAQATSGATQPSTQPIGASSLLGNVDLV